MAYGNRSPKLWRTPDEYGEFPELTEEQMTRIKERAMNYCLWSLGESSKTTKQLVDKMRLKNCPETIIDLTINKLTNDYHYLDDVAYATNYHLDKKSYGWGMNRITMELRGKGISDTIIQNLMDQVTPEDVDDERASARKFAVQKLKSTRSLDRQKRVNRVVGGLARKGFNMGVAYEVVNEVINEESEESEDQ